MRLAVAAALARQQLRRAQAVNRAELRAAEALVRSQLAAAVAQARLERLGRSRAQAVRWTPACSWTRAWIAAQA
jgi:hypothetical protein